MAEDEMQPSEPATAETERNAQGDGGAGAEAAPGLQAGEGGQRLESAEAEPQGPPPLELLELRVGRFQVPEDADDMLGLAHRLPGVVHVWLSGSTLCLECEPGAVDRQALAERLRDDGYPIRSG
jgi:hypothetical protein